MAYDPFPLPGRCPLPPLADRLPGPPTIASAYGLLALLLSALAYFAPTAGNPSASRDISL